MGTSLAISRTSSICKDPAAYKKAATKYLLISDTLRTLLGIRHKMESGNGTLYPTKVTSFPKSNWTGRERELIEYSKDIYALDPDLEGLLQARGKAHLENLLLSQALRSTSFKKSDKEPSVADGDAYNEKIAKTATGVISKYLKYMAGTDQH